MTQQVLESEPGTIAVVGGGIIGMSVAWRLAQRHWLVSVYDSGSIGGEASWAGAGMLAPGGEIDSASPIGHLASESRQIYSAFVRELEQASGVAIDFQECGALDLAYSSEELRQLNERAESQIALGIDSKPLQPQQVAKFWPRVRSEDLAGARFYRDDAIVDPRDLLAALQIACERQGVKLLDHQAVFEGEVGASGVAIKTAAGTSTFNAAVIASGAWSSSIPVRGIPALPSAEPVKGHLTGYKQPDQTCNTILRRGHTYLLQRANGLLIAGASVEHVGFDRSIKPEIAADLARQASFILPHLAETTPTDTWIGFRPASDSLHIGGWHSPRLYLAYGHFRNGILLAPVTADRIAAEITANLGIH